jgi:ABC-type multidrug transport system fused ATPase/permease subunit
MLQGALPIVAVGSAVAGLPRATFVALALTAPIVSISRGVRSGIVGTRTRRRALVAAARGIAATPAWTLRGGASDALTASVWRGAFAHEQLATDVAPALIGSSCALATGLVIAGALGGVKLVVGAAIGGLVGGVARRPLARESRARADALEDRYRATAIDFGHAVRGLEDLQAHGVEAQFAERIDRRVDALVADDRRANFAGQLATWVPIGLAGVAVAIGAMPGSVMTGGAWDPMRFATRVALVAALGPSALAFARALGVRSRLVVAARGLDEIAAREGALTSEITQAIAKPSGAASMPSSLLPIVLDDVEFSHATSTHGPALTSLSLTWSGARPLAIVGENGAGKSTLLGVLLGLLTPTRGTRTFGGVALEAIDSARFRARIAYVAQRPFLLEGMRVGEAMRVVAPAVADDVLLASLDRVGLGDRLRSRGAPLDVPCAALSVGEAQRVAIARALARAPELLFLDEPEAALDAEGRASLRSLLESLAREGTHVIVAAQHADAVPADADRVTLRRRSTTPDRATAAMQRT